MTSKTNYKGVNEFIEIAEKEEEKKERKSSLKKMKEEGWIIAKDKKLLPRLKNISMIFNTDKRIQNMFEYNEFTGDVFYIKDSPWGNFAGEQVVDEHDVLFKSWLCEEYEFEPSVKLINEAVLIEAWKRKRHPIKEYLESLTWDGEKRIDNWLIRVAHCENNEYTRSVGKKLLCAMVARIYKKGCKYDQMVIFEGKQGIYKSSMLEALGGEWYAPLTELSSHKEAVDIMRGKWLLEVEELAAMRKADLEHIKAFISRRTDRTRLPYGRRAQDFPRQSVICGTMNPVGDNEYFRDVSGNRRFWPVLCKEDIDLQWVKDNRDQLFAETMQVWQDESLFMDTEEAKEIAFQEQEKRKVTDAWEDIIQDYIDKKDHVTMHELMTNALKLPVDKINRTFTIRVGLIMGQLGWISVRYGRKQTKYFVRPGKDIYEIMRELKAFQPIWDES